MMLRKSVSVAAACVAFVSFGVEFPNSDGKGDLASADSWGGEVPAAGTPVSLTPSFDVTNYTFSSAVEFGQLLIPYANFGTSVSKYLNVVFDQTPYGDEQPLVKLAGFKLCDSNASPYPYVNVTFKGGIYDLLGQTLTGYYDHLGDYANVVRLTDGCVMTNTAGPVTGYPTIMRLELYGGSKFYGENSSAIGFSYDYGTVNGWTVTEGSVLDLKAPDIYIGRGKSGSRSVVSGEGTYVRVRGSYFNLGGSNFANRPETLTVTDHATFDMKSTYLYMPFVDCPAALTNTLVVSDYATLNLPSYVYLGQSGPNALMEVRSGAMAQGQTAGKNNRFIVGYAHPNNTLVLSNATLLVDQLFVGNGANGTNNTIIIQGADTVLSCSDTGMGHFNSRFNRWIIEKGAVFSLPFSAANYNKDNAAFGVDGKIIVRDGGTLTGNARTGGYYNFATVPVTTNNWIEAQDGGTVRCGVEITGRWCGLRVDDGTVVGNVTIGARDPGEWFDWGTNDFLTVRGDHPRICCTNESSQVRVRRHSTVTFELPDAGCYREGFATAECPLVEADTVTLAADTTLVVAGAAEMKAAEKYGDQTRVVLFSAKKGKLKVPQSVIDATQATLPERVTLKKVTKNDRDQLVLKFPGLKGSVLLIQ